LPVKVTSMLTALWLSLARAWTDPAATPGFTQTMALIATAAPSRQPTTTAATPPEPFAFACAVKTWIVVQTTMTQLPIAVCSP